MDHGRVVKKIFYSKLERGKMERPTMRWLKDVEKDPWEQKMVTEGNGKSGTSICN
jgi:hypothetical protein